MWQKQTRFSDKELAEVRRLRGEGQTKKWIAGRFKVSESYISRILRGERLSKGGT
jgi:DNA-binding CsgD family transcriptional regulator